MLLVNVVRQLYFLYDRVSLLHELIVLEVFCDLVVLTRYSDCQLILSHLVFLLFHFTVFGGRYLIEDLHLFISPRLVVFDELLHLSVFTHEFTSLHVETRLILFGACLTLSLGGHIFALPHLNLLQGIFLGLLKLSDRLVHCLRLHLGREQSQVLVDDLLLEEAHVTARHDLFGLAFIDLHVEGVKAERLLQEHLRACNSSGGRRWHAILLLHYIELLKNSLLTVVCRLGSSVFLEKLRAGGLYTISLLSHHFLKLDDPVAHLATL